MSEHNEDGLTPRGAEGAQLKEKITEQKGGDQGKTFDPGASMLGTDNETGSDPAPADEMATARNAPPPK